MYGIFAEQGIFYLQSRFSYPLSNMKKCPWFWILARGIFRKVGAKFLVIVWSQKENPLQRNGFSRLIQGYSYFHSMVPMNIGVFYCFEIVTWFEENMAYSKMDRKINKWYPKLGLI